jgi:hypothetical protein
MFSLRAEGFSCSLELLYGALGISKIAISIKKEKQFLVVFFLSILVIKNPGSGIT